MPMYDYRCDDCGTQFEVRMSFKEPNLKSCPAVNGPPACIKPGEGTVKKVFTDVGISFKGTGFYKNDHGSNASSSKAASSDKSSDNADSNSATNSDATKNISTNGKASKSATSSE